MAQFTFTIPDPIVSRVLNAFVLRGRQLDPPDIRDLTNDQKIAIFRTKIREFILEIVEQHETSQAIDTARKTAIEDARASIQVS